LFSFHFASSKRISVARDKEKAFRLFLFVPLTDKDNRKHQKVNNAGRKNEKKILLLHAEQRYSRKKKQL